LPETRHNQAEWGLGVGVGTGFPLIENTPFRGGVRDLQLEDKRAIVARGEEALVASANELAAETGRTIISIVADNQAVRFMVERASRELGRWWTYS